jgi:hypothetical protein
VRLPAWLSSCLGGKGDCMDVLHRQKGPRLHSHLVQARLPTLSLLHRAKSFRWRSLYRTALAPGLPRNIGGVLRGPICIKARGRRFLCRRTGPSSRRTRDSGTGIRPGRLHRLGVLWVRIGRLRNRNGWEHSDHKRDDKFWHSHLHSYSSSCRDHAALP